MFHLYSSLRRASARTAVLTLLAIGVLGAGAPGSAHAEPRGPCAGACAKVKVVHNTTAFSSPYFDALTTAPLPVGTYTASCEAAGAPAGRNNHPWWSKLTTGTWVHNGDLKGGELGKRGITPCASTPHEPQAPRVLQWAYDHVSWWAGLYSMDRRLPVNKDVTYMKTQQPPHGSGTSSNVQQGCDCSSFVRWAVAQAGIIVGTYTGDIWTGPGNMLGPRKPTSTSVNLPTGHAARGWGNLPAGGYRPGDLIF